MNRNLKRIRFSDVDIFIKIYKNSPKSLKIYQNLERCTFQTIYLKILILPLAAVKGRKLRNGVFFLRQEKSVIVSMDIICLLIVRVVLKEIPIIEIKRLVIPTIF